MSALDVVEAAGLWSLLSSRHQAMVSKISSMAEGLVSSNRLDPWDWKEWSNDLKDLVAAVRDDRQEVTSLETLIVSGYRKVEFSSSPQIEALEKDPDANLIEVGQEEIRRVRLEVIED